MPHCDRINRERLAKINLHPLRPLFEFGDVFVKRLSFAIRKLVRFADVWSYAARHRLIQSHIGHAGRNLEWSRRLVRRWFDGWPRRQILWRSLRRVRRKFHNEGDSVRRAEMR